MNDRTLRRFAGSALLLGVLSACGKKVQEPSRVPNLTMPVSAFPSDTFKPAKEASSSKGPVQLTLRLYKTRIKANESRWMGGSLWVQLELANMGELPLTVTDDMFYQPTEPSVSESSRVTGIALRVFDEEGQPLGYAYTVGCDQQLITDPKALPMWRRVLDAARSPGSRLLRPEDETPWSRSMLAKVKESRRRWRQQGLGDYEVELKSIRFLQDEQDVRDDKSKVDGTTNRSRELLPGASVASVPYAEADPGANCSIVPGRPLGPYSELRVGAFYPGFAPGKRYFIQAVYDGTSLKKLAFDSEKKRLERRLKSGKLSADEAAHEKKRFARLFYGTVRVETPKIGFEVMR